MKFGVFDHMDRAGADLGRQFEDRLRLVELYERAGLLSDKNAVIAKTNYTW